MHTFCHLGFTTAIPVSQMRKQRFRVVQRLTQHLTAGWQSQTAPVLLSPPQTHTDGGMLSWSLWILYMCPLDSKKAADMNPSPERPVCRMQAVPTPHWPKTSPGLREAFALRTARLSGQKVRVGARAQPTPFLEEPVMELKDKWNEKAEKWKSWCCWDPEARRGDSAQDGAKACWSGSLSPTHHHRSLLPQSVA